MKYFFDEIIMLHETQHQNSEFEYEREDVMWKEIKGKFLYDDEHKHIPIPVFSYVKPTMGARFLLHIMLSMGEFDTEMDFLVENVKGLRLKPAQRYWGGVRARFYFKRFAKRL